MPRTLEQIVQETLGAQVFAICRLQADNDALQAQIAAAAAKDAPTPPAPQPE